MKESQHLVKHGQGITNTEANVDNLLSSDLEISRASSMPLNPSLPGPVKLSDSVGREDVVPMDISPEPSRVVHQSRITSGHFLEKVTRARAFTTSVRLFGRDLSNGAPISPAASWCESEAIIASCVRVVPSQAQSCNFLQLIRLFYRLNMSHHHQMRWILIALLWKVSLFHQRQTVHLQLPSPQSKGPQASKTCSMIRPLLPLSEMICLSILPRQVK